MKNSSVVLLFIKYVVEPVSHTAAVCIFIVILQLQVREQVDISLERMAQLRDADKLVSRM